MGRSAKFYKRPSKKEKECDKIKKTVASGSIKKSKKTSVSTAIKALSEDVEMTAPIKASKSEKVQKKEDVDMMNTDEIKPVQQKEETPAEIPDYVDLFSGKKTYKKIPKKRK
ncbi:hypothetical protein BDB01DRAFT_785495 [Pilobolus umbonatus]|nr:hypothetical protein BDB01DRAFT_785495 [Pilobolus umbonatus]